ncbi:MAG: twin-arginine translocation pathway signal protein [Bacteroidetes bacterium]|nr:MAG: twin-arginine translocation pathway signal protein [Bacteroidota bacterium]
MNRREALSTVALILGGTIVGANAFLEGCTPADKKTTPEAGGAITFSNDDIAYLDEIAETIIPATSTPGAKAAKVGTFMTVMVKDCYTDDDQKTFMNGMKQINEESKKKFNKTFMEADAKQRTELLTELDKQTRQSMANEKPGDPKPYFRLMKELTLLGYFTSEVGATQALRYVAVPGRYEGCIPYKKGDKAWATA